MLTTAPCQNAHITGPSVLAYDKMEHSAALQDSAAGLYALFMGKKMFTVHCPVEKYRYFYKYVLKHACVCLHVHIYFLAYIYRKKKPKRVHTKILTVGS